MLRSSWGAIILENALASRDEQKKTRTQRNVDECRKHKRDVINEMKEISKCGTAVVLKVACILGVLPPPYQVITKTSSKQVRLTHMMQGPRPERTKPQTTKKTKTNNGHDTTRVMIVGGVR